MSVVPETPPPWDGDDGIKDIVSRKSSHNYHSPKNGSTPPPVVFKYRY